jgi:hypothetical protein
MLMRRRRHLAIGWWLGVAGALLLPAGALAQSMMPAMLVDRTPTYTVVLTIGPAEQMMAPGSAIAGQMGEVMVTGGPTMATGMAGQTSIGGGSTGMSGGMGNEMSNGMGTTANMSTAMDQGMGVNHHLEIHITRNDDNSGVQDVTPVIRVTDKATGESRDLPQVMGMYSAQMGPADFHYGQNVWLPDGTYTVTTLIGADTATFHDVSVLGGGIGMGSSGEMGMGH